MLYMLKTTLLFFATALCEIIGCFYPGFRLKRGATPWLLMPTAWRWRFCQLLTLPRQADGFMPLTVGYMSYRAAVAALGDGVKLSHYDWAGALVALCGMLIIVVGWGRA